MCAYTVSVVRTAAAADGKRRRPSVVTCDCDTVPVWRATTRDRRPDPVVVGTPLARHSARVRTPLPPGGFLPRPYAAGVKIARRRKIRGVRHESRLVKRSSSRFDVAVVGREGWGEYDKALLRLYAPKAELSNGRIRDNKTRDGPHHARTWTAHVPVWKAPNNSCADTGFVIGVGTNWQLRTWFIEIHVTLGSWHVINGDLGTNCGREYELCDFWKLRSNRRSGNLNFTEVNGRIIHVCVLLFSKLELGFWCNVIFFFSAGVLTQCHKLKMRFR